MTAQTHLPEKWIERSCALLEIPVNHEVIRFFTSMQRAEGGAARWNPINTTNRVHSSAHGDWQSLPDYNSTGVCNYNHPWQGILATVDTLEQDAFSDLTAGLRHAKANAATAEEIVEGHESAIRMWGTNPQTMLDVLQTLP